MCIRDRANEAGAKVVALTMPILVGMNMSLGTFCALFQLPGWMDYFNMGIDARMEKFRDPEVVTWLENQAALPEAGVFSRLTGWDNYMVGDTYSEANEGLKGRTLGDIARERGQRAFHTMVEISLNDDLKTVWWPLPTDDDAESWRLRAQAWEHPNVMIGGSDAGAHLDRMAGAPYTTAWLADCLRGRQLTSMENAVRHLTDVPARLFGFTERGRMPRVGMPTSSCSIPRRSVPPTSSWCSISPATRSGSGARPPASAECSSMGSFPLPTAQRPVQSRARSCAPGSIPRR